MRVGFKPGQAWCADWAKENNCFNIFLFMGDGADLLCYSPLMFWSKVCFTSLDQLWISVRNLMFTLSTSKLPAKQVRSRKWRESAERATAMTQRELKTSSRWKEVQIWCFSVEVFQNMTHLMHFPIIFSFVGGQAYRSASSDHCMWSLWLCSWLGAQSVPQQSPEIHWNLRAKSKKLSLN